MDPTCCTTHRWPRQKFDSRLNTSHGSREEITCNDCLAVKITFVMHDGRTIVKLVEPK